jgi:hypothetical protein
MNIHKDQPAAAQNRQRKGEQDKTHLVGSAALFVVLRVEGKGARVVSVAQGRRRGPKLLDVW